MRYLYRMLKFSECENIVEIPFGFITPALPIKVVSLSETLFAVLIPGVWSADNHVIVGYPGGGEGEAQFDPFFWMWNKHD